MALIRRFVIPSLRLLVTGGLLWGLARRLDLARAAAIIARASFPLLAAALLALIATAFVNAWRWRLILAAGGSRAAAGSLVKLLFVGLFFNQVLPTGVGGDAVRAWRCRRLGIGLAPAIRSVLLDRASGYLVTLLLFAAGLPALFGTLSDEGERVGMLMVLGAGLSGLLVLFLSDFLPARVLRFPLLAALADLSRESRRLFFTPRQAAAVLGLSLLTVGFPILAYALVGRSLGTDLSLKTWLMVVPPVTLVQLLPVSFAGWGIREIGMVVILAGFGVGAEAALAISVMMGLGLVALGLPGGLVWFADWDVPRPQATTGRERAQNPEGTR